MFVIYNMFRLEPICNGMIIVNIPHFFGISSTLFIRASKKCGI